MIAIDKTNQLPVNDRAKIDQNLEPAQIQTAHYMLGLEYYYDDHLLAAARFLSGKEDPVNELGHLIHADDPEAALMFAFDIDRTEYNRKALKEIAELLENNKILAKGRSKRFKFDGGQI